MSLFRLLPALNVTNLLPPSDSCCSLRECLRFFPQVSFKAAQTSFRAKVAKTGKLHSLGTFPEISRPVSLPLSEFILQLEATYCDLENLDNETPEVVELRSQRIERALWINERLIALGDGKSGEDDDDMEDSDEEDEGADSEDEDEPDRLARRLGKQRLGP